MLQTQKEEKKDEQGREIAGLEGRSRQSDHRGSGVRHAITGEEVMVIAREEGWSQENDQKGGLGIVNTGKEGAVMGE